MSSAGWLIGLILIAVVLLLVIAPLLGRGRQRPDALSDRQRERLRVYYDRALRNIRDLDEDHALGKLDEDEYTAERAYWSERGIQALKALDQIATLNAGGSAAVDGESDDAAIDRAIDTAIETAVRSARERSAAGLGL